MANIGDAIYIERFIKGLIVNRTDCKATDCNGTKCNWNEL